MYAFMRARPDAAKLLFDQMSASLAPTERSYRGAFLSILRSPIALRGSTTPVMSINAPPHPALQLPLPGLVPYQRVLPLNQTTIACLILGDFDDCFLNEEIDAGVSQYFNRHFVAQFAHFEHVRHLVTDRGGLIEDMTWAPYEVVDEGDRKIKFYRRAEGQL